MGFLFFYGVLVTLWALAERAQKKKAQAALARDPPSPSSSTDGNRYVIVHRRRGKQYRLTVSASSEARAVLVALRDHKIPSNQIDAIEKEL